MSEFGIFWVVIGLPALYLILGTAAAHHVASGKRVLPRLPEVPEYEGQAKLKKRELIYRGHAVRGDANE